MNRPVPHRYAGYRSPIPNAHIARALGDMDDVLREAVKADNLRRFREANPANDRFAGPPRHYRVGGHTVLDTLCIAGAVIIAAYFVAQLVRGLAL